MREGGGGDAGGCHGGWTAPAAVSERLPAIQNHRVLPEYAGLPSNGSEGDSPLHPGEEDSTEGGAIWCASTSCPFTKEERLGICETLINRNYVSRKPSI